MSGNADKVAQILKFWEKPQKRPHPLDQGVVGQHNVAHGQLGSFTSGTSTTISSNCLYRICRLLPLIFPMRLQRTSEN
jgi:hypothetical protein